MTIWLQRLCGSSLANLVCLGPLRSHLSYLLSVSASWRLKGFPQTRPPGTCGWYKGVLGPWGQRAFPCLVLILVRCSATATHMLGILTLAEEEKASQAGRLAGVGSSLWSFLYKLEGTGHLQLLEILRNIVSQPASESSSSVYPWKCQVLMIGSFKNSRKVTQDRILQLLAIMSLCLNQEKPPSSSQGLEQLGDQVEYNKHSPCWSRNLAQDQQLVESSTHLSHSTQNSLCVTLWDKYF